MENKKQEDKVTDLFEKKIKPNLNLIHKDLLSITELDGGRSNYTYLLKLKEKSIIIKYAEKYHKISKIPLDENRLVSEARALKFFKTILPNGFIPHLLHCNKNVIVMYFVKGERVKDLIIKNKVNPLVFNQIAETLSFIHNYTYQQNQLAREIRKDEHYFKNFLLRSFCLDIQKNVLQKSKNMLNDLYKESLTNICTLNTGDFDPNDVLFNGENITIIDLEEAGLGDPAYELGRFVGEILLLGNLSNNVLNNLSKCVNNYINLLKIPQRTNIKPRIIKFAAASVIFRVDGFSSFITGNNKEIYRKAGERLLSCSELEPLKALSIFKEEVKKWREYYL